MRILWCAVVLAACGPAATPAPATVENEEPGEIIDEEPPAAVVVVIDRSGSMTGAKTELAKEGARMAVEELPADALFAVVAFDSEASVLVPMQEIRHHDEIYAGIETLTPGGGTNYYPGLATAAEMLDAVKATRKLVVFLSDGEAPYDGVVELVTDMAARGVQTTTVGFEGADRVLLGQMAEAGNGSLFMLGDVENLPRVIIKAIQER